MMQAESIFHVHVTVALLAVLVTLNLALPAPRAIHEIARTPPFDQISFIYSILYVHVHVHDEKK